MSERLTKKNKSFGYKRIRKGIPVGAIVNKLGKYENIEEEELGIDLFTFIKAHKGIYYKNMFNEICYCEHPDFFFNQAPSMMKWQLFVYGSELTIRRYGKQWALTKEELEK